MEHYFLYYNYSYQNWKSEQGGCFVRSEDAPYGRECNCDGGGQEHRGHYERRQWLDFAEAVGEALGLWGGSYSDASPYQKGAEYV